MRMGSYISRIEVYCNINRTVMDTAKDKFSERYDHPVRQYPSDSVPCLSTSTADDDGNMQRGWKHCLSNPHPFLRPSVDWVWCAKQHSVTVENALFADPRLLDCAVVGIPDKRLGELVAALVVPRMEWLDKVTEGDVLEKVKPRSVPIKIWWVFERDVCHFSTVSNLGLRNGPYGLFNYFFVI